MSVPGRQPPDEEQLFEDLGVGCDCLVVDFDLSGHAARAEEVRRAGGDDRQQAADGLAVAHFGDVGEVAPEQRGDVAVEEEPPASRAAMLGAGEAACGDPVRIGRPTYLSGLDLRHLSLQQSRKERLAMACDLAPRERREPEVVDLPGSASAIVGSVRMFAEPVSRNCPGSSRWSSRCLMASSSSGALWISSITGGPVSEAM